MNHTGEFQTPEDYYANVNTWLNKAKVASYAVVTLLSDLVLVRRAALGMESMRKFIAPLLSSTERLWCGHETTGSSFSLVLCGSSISVRNRSIVYFAHTLICCGTDSRQQGCLYGLRGL